MKEIAGNELNKDIARNELEKGTENADLWKVEIRKKDLICLLISFARVTFLKTGLFPSQW